MGGGTKAVMTLHEVAQDGGGAEVGRGINVEELDANGLTALLWGAVAHGQVVAMRVLLALADKEAKDNSEETALHWAAAAGVVEAMKLVAHLGVDNDAKTAVGATALQGRERLSRRSCWRS